MMAEESRCGQACGDDATDEGRLLTKRDLCLSHPTIPLDPTLSHTSRNQSQPTPLILSET